MFQHCHSSITDPKLHLLYNPQRKSRGIKHRDQRGHEIRPPLLIQEMETLSSTTAQSYKNGTHECDGKFSSFTTFQNRFSISFLCSTELYNYLLHVHVMLPALIIDHESTTMQS